MAKLPAHHRRRPGPCDREQTVNEAVANLGHGAAAMRAWASIAGAARRQGGDALGPEA